MSSSLSRALDEGEEVNVTLGSRSGSDIWGEGRKSTIGELNPLSTSFTPFASPPRTMPDIGNLSLSDKGSSIGEAPSLNKTPSQNGPASAQGDSHRTPALSSASRFSTWSRWDEPSSGTTPFTPLTPVTPFTPLQSKVQEQIRKPFSPFEPSSSMLGSKGKGKGKAPEVLRGDGHEGEAQTAEEIGRYLMITNLSSDITAQDIKNVVKRLARFKILIAKNLQTMGCVTVVFFDPREAAKVYHYLQSHTVALYANSPLVELHCIGVDRDDVEQDASRGPEWQDFWSDIESTVLINIEGGHGVSYDVMKSVCSKVGEVQHLQEIGSGGREFLVEFWDTRHATEIVETLHNRANGGMTVKARLYTTDQPIPFPAARDFRKVQAGPARFSSPVDWFADPSPARTLFQPPPSSRQPADDVFGPFKPINTNNPSSSFASSSIWPAPTMAPRTPATSAHRDDDAPLPRPYGSFNTSITPLRFQAMERRISEAGAVRGMVNQVDMAARARREDASGPVSPSASGWGAGRFGSGAGRGGRNFISPDKRIRLDMIESGEEMRTTVMVKDVPNKLSRQELVDILRDVVPGGFDFVYLRFDFKNACNVGYAFVNFTSPEALTLFHQKRVGQKWKMFSSEKVLQICWADIQGKERLINKFRNSDVMTAPEPWRPQIFYSSGPLKGCPEPFPEPDHPSKMRSNHLHYASNTAGGYDYDTANDYNYTSADFDAAYGF